MTLPEIVWGIVAGLGWILIGAGFINEAARRRQGVRLIPLGRGFFYVTLPVVLVSYLFLVYVLILVFVGVPEGPPAAAGGENGGGAAGPEGALAGLPETVRVIASFLSSLLLIAGLVYFVFATPQRLAPLLARRRLEVDESALRLLRSGDQGIELAFENLSTRSFLAEESVGLFAPGYQEREVVELASPGGTRVRVTLSPDEETSPDLPSLPDDDLPRYRVFRTNDQAFLRWALKTHSDYRSD